MLAELLMFFCEPDGPFVDAPVREIRLLAKNNDDMAGLVKVSPPVIAYYGEHKGKSAEHLVLQPRWQGHTLTSVTDDYGVMYITPVFDSEIDEESFFSKEDISVATEAMGYCVVASQKVAKEKFKIES